MEVKEEVEATSDARCTRGDINLDGKLAPCWEEVELVCTNCTVLGDALDPLGCGKGGRGEK